MTVKERFHACMKFEPMDRPPLREWGPWTQTWHRWLREGMPESGPPQFAECDHWLDCGLDFGFVPKFEVEEIARDEHTRTYRTAEGQVVRELHERELSMPEFLEYPVKTRRDFERLKERLHPSSPERYPANWDERVRELNASEGCVFIHGGRCASFFGGLREWMGPEALMIALYDDPTFVQEMMEFKADFIIGVMERALKEARVDFVQLWEDMAYHTASLISPAMFRKFMLPCYQRVTEFIRAHGVEVIMVDSDGHVAELIPLWLEGGVNCIYPMEVAAGMDVVELRRQYGKDLLMTGGLDKRAIAASGAIIDAELERKVPLAHEGGYIPHCDHSMPPDISWEAFCYYWDRKKALLGIE
ncbi:MAG: uroporphyrinogen decarboxylase family protein [Candidatus Zipacnadales bacterium]